MRAKSARLRRACCFVLGVLGYSLVLRAEGYSTGTQVTDALSFKEVASIFVAMAPFLKATIAYRRRTAEYP